MYLQGLASRGNSRDATREYPKGQAIPCGYQGGGFGFVLHRPVKDADPEFLLWSADFKIEELSLVKDNVQP